MIALAVFGATISPLAIAITFLPAPEHFNSLRN
jgi:hypothetical protein